MIDIASQLNAIYRKVEQLPPADGSGERVSVLLRRGYDAPIGDVWDAVTQPDRIKRWFMPISGELRVGGEVLREGDMIVNVEGVPITSGPQFTTYWESLEKHTQEFTVVRPHDTNEVTFKVTLGGSGLEVAPKTTLAAWGALPAMAVTVVGPVVDGTI